MITLPPSGDILLEGLGKVGEYKVFTFEVEWRIRGVDCNWGDISTDEEEVIECINLLLTNGFQPKKWEE